MALLALGSCQGGYPIAPTDCDRWCEATKELQCSYYDPAGCVASCEQEKLTAIPACRSLFDDALSCYEGATIPCDPDDPFFYFEGPWPCQSEESALRSCAARHRQDCIDCTISDACVEYCRTARETTCGIVDEFTCQVMCSATEPRGRRDCVPFIVTLTNCLSQVDTTICDPNRPQPCYEERAMVRTCGEFCPSCF